MPRKLIGILHNPFAQAFPRTAAFRGKQQTQTNFTDLAQQYPMTRRFSVPNFLATLIGGLLFCSLLPFGWAQNVELLAPQRPEVMTPEVREGEQEPTEEPVGLVDEDVALLESLRAIVLVDDADAVDPAGLPGLDGVLLEDLDAPEPDVLRDRLAAFLGEPFSTGDLRTITREIILHYREEGRPVVDVITPAQDLTPGALQLIVIEGIRGEILVQGNEWFSSERIAGFLRTPPGAVLRQRQLLADLDWINENPFRRVDLIYTPGEGFAETDLILQTSDRLPLRAYLGIENTGTDQTGEELLLAGFNWGDAFWMDHLISYQFSTTTDFESLRSHSAVYEIPLPWRHWLRLLGLYVETETDDAVGGQTLGTTGESIQSSLQYEAPLPRFGEYAHSLTLGFDFKQTNNNLEFGGFQVFDVTTQIFQFSLGYNSEWKDRFGVTSASLRGVWSPGGFTNDNSDEVFEQSRAFATADYLYGEANLSRITRLPADFSFYTRFRGQLSNANLLASEQLGLGGYNSVRGYDNFAVRGDNGLIVNVELRTPAVSVLKHLGLKKVRDNLQLLAFYDYGVVSSVDKLPGEPDSISLQGAGIGLRYNFQSNLAVRLDYGWQLEDLPFQDPDGDNGRLDFSAVLSF